MKLGDEIITVVNAKLDPETRKDVYHSTVIVGASWHCSVESAVDKGLKAANKYIVRIPSDADFSGKTYASSQDYDKAQDVSNLFTLKDGDIIVHGAVTEGSLKPAELHKQYEAFTVLSVTPNNRPRTRSPHWKVVGA